MFQSKKKNSNTPLWDYRTQGVIWRLIPTDDGLFVAEERDLPNKTTSFFSLHQQSGKVLWEQKTFCDPWWVGIEGIEGDTLFLHGFATPDMPGHKGITAVDVKTGNQLWSNDELRFLFANGDSVFASQQSLTEETFVELDSRTGTVKRNLVDGDENLFDENSQPSSNEGEIPTLIFDIEDNQLPEGAIIRNYIPVEEVTGPIELISSGNMLIFNYYTGTTPNIQSHIKIVDTETNLIVYEDTIETGLKGPVVGSFFVRNNILYYVKNRKHLKAVNLSHSAEKNMARNT